MTTLLGMMTGWSLAAIYVVVRALSRSRRGQPLPMGPAFLIGALLTVIAS